MDKWLTQAAVILFVTLSIVCMPLAKWAEAKGMSVEEEILEILKDEEVIEEWKYQELKEKAEKEKKKGMLSKEGWNLTFSGSLEFEYVDTQSDAEIDTEDPHVQLDKFTLTPKISSDMHNISLWAEFEGHSEADDGTFVCAFEAAWDKLPLNSKLSLGLLPRMHRTSRGTEVYPMIGTATWRYESYQIRWLGKHDPVYWGLSFGEGLRLGTKQVSEDSSYKMFRDNKNTGEKMDHHEVGLMLGATPEFGEKTSLDVVGFGYFGELSQDDIDELADELPTYDSDDDDQTRIGGRVTLKYTNLKVVGEVASMTDGKLDRDGWYLQCSYKFKTGNKKYFSSVEPLVRYGKLDVDWDKSFDDSATWDREMTVLALITEVAKNVKLKTEYYMNDEDTGNGEVDNDEFLAQVQFKF
ncbi:MAG: hypothetical protein SVY10_08045 [Thermodesulfobacteriota bacterium]|nr:hypothetical protein [Thermodesulfobacteriota bacterium]